MTDRRRRQTLAALLALPAAAGVRAQAFPSRPIRVIVGYSPGGAVDIIARALGEQLRHRAGPADRGGEQAGRRHQHREQAADRQSARRLHADAGGQCAGGQRVAVPAAAVYCSSGITPVALVGRVPVVLATRTDSPVDSIKAVIQSSKAKPDSIDLRTARQWVDAAPCGRAVRAAKPGSGSRDVPYKGGAPAITDVLGGQTPGGRGQRPRGTAARQGRQAAGAGGDERGARGHLSGCPDSRRVRVSGVRGDRSGTASWVRPGCRQPLSRACTNLCRGLWRHRRCASG